MDARASRILILGGYGNTGRRLARLLVSETDARIVVAGRNELRARHLAEALNEDADAERVRGMAVNAADPAAVRAALYDVDLVVVASSTSDHAVTVARAALEVGTDLLELQYGTEKTRTLRRMAPEVAAAGLCFVVDGGFHPGLPAVLIRHVAGSYDELDTVRVAAALDVDWKSIDFSPGTAREFAVEVARTRMRIVDDGGWRPVRWWSARDFRSFDFGPPLGTRTCVPMYLDELEPLTEWHPSLREAGFYMAGHHWYVDWIVMPGMVALVRLGATGQRLAARWLVRALRATAAPPFQTVVRVEAEGRAGGRTTRVRVTLAHQDAYDLTAIPVTATILQLLEGSVRKPGVHFQAHLAQPARLLSDMARMGVDIREEWETGSAVGRDDDRDDGEAIRGRDR